MKMGVLPEAWGYYCNHCGWDHNYGCAAAQVNECPECRGRINFVTGTKAELNKWFFERRAAKILEKEVKK